MFVDILREIESDKSHPKFRIGAKIARLADQYGMNPRGVCRFADLLARQKLKPRDVSEESIAVAEMIERRDRKERQAWVKRILSPRAKPMKFSPLVKRVHEVLTSEGLSFTLKAVKLAKAMLRRRFEIELEDVTEDVLAKVALYDQQNAPK